MNLQLLLIGIIFFSNLTFSKGIVISKSMKKNYKEYICKQKNLPIEINYLVNDRQIEVDLTFQKEIQQFRVQSIRGIDGVIVSDFQETSPKDVKPRQKQQINIQYSKTPGMGGAVMELSGIVNGLKKIQIISISVGDLSEEQLDQRQRDIVEINSAVPSGPFNMTGEKKEKVHRIKLQE